MMTFRETADVVLSASRAEQTEVVVIQTDDNLTRFANNYIHQNVTERNAQVIVRAVLGRRAGVAISNDTQPDSLKRLAERATLLSRLAPENPEFKGLPSPQKVSPVAGFDHDTANCSPQQRATRVGVICKKAASAGYSAAGSIRTVAVDLGVANSRGVFAQSKTSVADLSTVITATNSTGWAQASATHLDGIDAEVLADKAVQKARMGANPVEFQPGEYTVILDPYATSDILSSLAFVGMGAMTVQEERSWLNGRIGQKLMADSVTIVDDGWNASGIPAPFDYEGMPKQQVAIVESGVAKGPVYDSFTAGREAGRQSTGHATPASPTEILGPVPTNLFLKPGNSSVDEMIRSTKLGLYITRFWYTRVVHPRDAVITGMTRDGTFVVKDGEIAYPVKSMRFTQSYIEALGNAEAIGSNPLVLWSEFLSFTTTVPAVKLGRFRFTSGTR
jgi:predicted Zn-dependent protease